jgi:hypothetical protein
MTMCSHATPPFSISAFSEPLAISVVLMRAPFLSVQHLDAFLGGQHDVSVLVVAHALGGEVQQDVFGAFVVVSAQAVRTGSQQLLAQVSPETLCVSFAQQLSLALVVQTSAGSALVELLLPHAFVPTSAVVGASQHEVVGFCFTGPKDVQDELVGFGFTIAAVEQQESVDSCFVGADDEQQVSDAFDF